MIVRERPSRLDLIFAIRGSIVPAIAPDILALMGIGAALHWLKQAYDFLPSMDAAAYTVFGIALSLFLGFRNNAAYDRWWEARCLWGGLLADLRSFAREVEIFVTGQETRKELLRYSLAFLNRHRANLRAETGDANARASHEDLSAPGYLPCTALNQVAARVRSEVEEGRIGEFGAKALSERLASMTLGQAGCERIAGTPLPYVYSLLIYRTTYIYCLLLPLALADPLGWMTPVFVGIVAYVFLGLAEVTEELNHPFQRTANGLALDAICREAERSLAPHLAEEPRPSLEAENYFLS